MNNPYSFSSVKLDLYSKEGSRLKTASGFVLEAGGRYFLITNWHVLTGKDFAKEEQESAIEPFMLKTSIHIYSGGDGIPTLLSYGLRRRITIPLYDEGNAPAWMELRAGQAAPLKADMAAVPIPSDKSMKFNETLRLLSLRITESTVHANQWTKVSSIPISTIDTEVDYGPPDPVHVVGYPLGWAPDGNERSSSAFWKTSSIASEIYEPGMQRRAYTFFVDPRAPEGMNGSPVIGMKKDRMKLLGVYSDSSTTDFGANAGLVWDACLLKELIHVS